MLGFELCRELRKAGFPQRLGRSTQHFNGPYHLIQSEYDPCEMKDMTFIPKTDDLLNELGHSFEKLVYEADHWHAYGGGEAANGKNVNEALARLFLKLKPLRKKRK